jgi:glutamate-1-semialdehyde 2,1-aminomutase
MSKKSDALFNEMKTYIPGGVNSPARAFSSVNMDPIYIDHAEGSKIYDVDGKEYIDFVCSWGPLILGHREPRVMAKVKDFLEKGTSFGANTEIELEFAKLITSIYPSIEQIRMVNSGTEATMSAVRLARGYTKKSKIIKFEGCYHGHGDSFLIKAGSGVMTLGIPGSPGITEGTAQDTLVAQFNDIDSVNALIKENKGDIAAIILEPVVGNAGVIPPMQGFLAKLREVTAQNDILLIFDEVITGFRVALGGAQALYGIKPDLTCLGKIIGGGFPVGAFGGKKEIMQHLAPVGPVYQAGTLSGNPLAMVAGFETVSILKNENIHEQLERKAQALEIGFRENLQKLDVDFKLNRVGAMMCMFFNDTSVDSYKVAAASDTKKFAAYFEQMIKEGIYIAPSQFEAAFVSAALSDDDIKKTVEAHYNSLKNLG